MPHNTIMFVDDEPRLLSGIRRRLSSDYTVVTFESGTEALAYLAEPNDVSVIVADMQMPEMNGVELLKKVADLAPDIRRLMLTGNSDQETAMAAINEGKVFRFIRKPCETAELKTIINQVIEDYEFQKTDLEQLTAASDAEEKPVNVQKNFLSVMNHELRTPLSQIITMSEIINRDAVKLDPNKLSNFLTQINKSGAFALRQVDRILEYTRLQSEETKVSGAEKETHNCDIVEIFKKEIAAATREAGDKLITFSLESVRKKANIAAPRLSVELMVRELLDNAVKFSPFGGHISVMLKYDKTRVAARISDGGVGISPALADALENGSVCPFQTQEKDHKVSHEGLGLGLSLVQAIAQKYETAFDLKSTNSGGAAAILVFNRAAIQPMAVTPESAKETPQEDLRLAS